jgi:bidirectional [NiFe] hydrogenase diaphorase subunit
MLSAIKKPTPPSDDKRWKIVDAAMRRHGYAPSALIETLHSLQEAFGHVSEESLRYIAESLNLPPSKVYGVATFYNLFNMKPLGRHVLSLCTGTACFVKGAGEISQFMKEEYGLCEGDTSADGNLTFMVARCVGACGLAPVMILDGKVVGKLSVEQMKDKIREWMSHDE